MKTLRKNNNNTVLTLKNKEKEWCEVEEGDDGFVQLMCKTKRGFYKLWIYPEKFARIFIQNEKNMDGMYVVRKQGETPKSKKRNKKI